jgi:hypothetical protein
MQQVHQLSKFRMAGRQASSLVRKRAKRSTLYGKTAGSVVQLVEKAAHLKRLPHLLILASKPSFHQTAAYNPTGLFWVISMSMPTPCT